jgi:hypothetical protein
LHNPQLDIDWLMACFCGLPYIELLDALAYAPKLKALLKSRLSNMPPRQEGAIQHSPEPRCITFQEYEATQALIELSRIAVLHPSLAARGTSNGSLRRQL